MDFLLTIWGTVIPFLIILTVLIFVHEMGHFMVARRAGVRVEVFSIGFGRELLGRTDRFGTRWRLSSVPLGGYVKMFGEGDIITGIDDTEDRPMSEAEKKVSFHHKSLGRRTAIVAAGPVANFIFAVAIFAFIAGVVGIPRFESGVGEVIPDTAAEVAGFATGDRIVAIDGQAVQWFDELSEIVAKSAGVTLSFEVVRDQKTLTLRATPRWINQAEMDSLTSDAAHEALDSRATPDPSEKERRGLLGVRPHPEMFVAIRMGPGAALGAGVAQTYALSTRILGVLLEMIEGERSADELGGVISIAKYSGEAANDGLVTTLMLMAALSVNLGLINLFPVPMLDGGHLAFYFVEALRGRPLSERTQEYGFRIGLILVVALMVFATWNDLRAL